MSLLSRRSVTLTLASAAALPMAGGLYRSIAAPKRAEIPDGVYNDAFSPVGGNEAGDVTIVAYLDYNCPFCKKSAPDLARIVKDDGRIRLIYKDWPVLAESSVYGAQLALGAKFQGKYELAHHALMSIPGYGVAKERMSQGLRAAGVDMRRLQADLDAHGEEIGSYLRRNLTHAEAMGIQGTPTYIIGPFIASTLNYDQFKQAVAEARKRAAG